MYSVLFVLYFMTNMMNFSLSFPRSIGYLRHHTNVLTRRQVVRLHSTKPPFYITTPIYYVNGLPHLGHAYTSVLTDTIARFHRDDGKEVKFVSGTDEHGQKVQQSALKLGLEPLRYADDISSKFRQLANDLQCTPDDFVRTTEERHKKAVLRMWAKLEENGFIYRGKYEGWYSVTDEAFYMPDEIVNGKAPTGADVTWVTEESYFFKLSDWTDRLIRLYEENPDSIMPRSRRNEVLGFLKQPGGLKDLSISRASFSWGIPVPGDSSHVIYVWLDALVNYLSVLGYGTSSLDVENNKGDTLPNASSSINNAMCRFWPCDLHIVGKDILRFHAVYWPAFLMAADLAPPKRIFAHGWWTQEGTKMSKSLGNVVDPQHLLQLYGVDYLRYYLVSEIHFGNDGDFTHKGFIERINSDLADDIGNLVQRVLTMTVKNFDGRVPEPGNLTEEDKHARKIAYDALNVIRQHVDKQNLKMASEEIVAVAKMGNKYIDNQAPWKLLKQEGQRERVGTVMYTLMEILRCVGVYLKCIVPSASDRMLSQLSVPAELQTFASLSFDTAITPGTPLTNPTPLFPKLVHIAEDVGK